MSWAEMSEPQRDAYEKLYNAAEWAMACGLTLLTAVQAVTDGYSSAEFDQRYKAGEFE